MKLLFISNGFPPEQWAGTETYTAGIAHALQTREHDIQILCGGDWDAGPTHWLGFSDEWYGRLPVRRLHLNWTRAADPTTSLYNNPVVAAWLADYLDEIRPDLVHVTSCERLSASILPVIKASGLPLVLSLTDFWFLCPRTTLVRSSGENCSGLTSPWDCLRCQLFNAKAYRWPRRVLPESMVEDVLTTISHFPILTRQRGLRGLAGDMAARKAFLRQAIELPDVRLTASAFVHDVFQSNGIEAEIEVQPYGHDLAWLEHFAGKRPSEVLRVAFVGQLIESKGVDLLLRAGQLLREAYGDRLAIQIYGNLDKEPAFGTRLRALATEQPNVTFRGTYRHEDSGAIFSAMDVLVVPSLWYDFPLVIHEAFATGTPVIATDLGGMAEAVTPDVSGLRFVRGDAADLARQIQRLLDEPGLLARLASGVPPVKTVAQEAVELETIYRLARQKHLRRSTTPRPPVP